MTVTVREVRETDFPALAAFEQKVWGPLGTPVLSAEELAAWHAEGSPFFFLAEDADGICGYQFGRQLDFLPEEPDWFLAEAHRTERGEHVHPHNPNGKALNGVCIVASRKGVGSELRARLTSLLREHGMRYYFGVARMPGFNSFMEESGIGPEVPEMEAVAWYAHENGRLLGWFSWPNAERCPAIQLPRLTKPDPVLRFHSQDPQYGFLRLVPEYMQDPESRNYGLLTIAKLS